MKREVKKGTMCFIVDENKERANGSISMDKDRVLDIGDIFKFNEDWENHKSVPMVVVGFLDFFPLIVEMAV